jgi:hypothetical protein
VERERKREEEEEEEEESIPNYFLAPAQQL